MTRSLLLALALTACGPGEVPDAGPDAPFADDAGAGAALLGFPCVQYNRFPDLSGCGGGRGNGMINGVCVGEPPPGDPDPTAFVGVCRPWRPAGCRLYPEECSELGGVGVWTARGACVCVPGAR